jgi:putative methionine-R-sulfoxide reductase with GAF domain
MITWQYTPFLLLILGAGLFTTLLAFYTWRRRAIPGAWLLFAILATASIWSYGYAVEIAAATLPGKLIGLRLQYLGIPTLPVAWLIFAMTYTGHARWIQGRNVLWLLAIPAVTIGLNWTNAWHGLYYAVADVRTAGGLVHFAPTYGPWFWVHSTYSYLCYLVGAILIFQRVRRTQGLERQQSLTMLAGSFPPFITSLVFVVSPSDLDPAPITFTISSALFSWGFFRLRLLDFFPTQIQPLSLTPQTRAASAIQVSRKRILNVALIGIAVLSLLQLLANVLNALSTPPLNWGNLMLYLAGYGLLAAVAFGRRVPYTLRALVFLTIVFLFVLSNLFAHGLDFDGGVAFFAFVIFSYIFFGGRASLLALAVTLLTVGVTAWLLLTGRYAVTPFYEDNTGIAVVFVPLLSFTLFVSVALVALATLQQDLRNLLQRSQDLSAELDEQRALLEERVQERTRALAASAEVSRRLSTILDQNQLVREVVTQLQATFNYYHVHIYLWDETRTRLHMVSGSGRVGQELLARGHSLDPTQGLVGRAATTASAVLASDVHAEPGWLPNPLLPDTRCEAAVPIALGGEALGVLDVQQQQPGALEKSDVDLLESIANQLAIALRNARLYAETQRQAEREALVNQIGQKILQTTDVESAMQAAVRELGRALGARQARVQLGARESDNGRSG